MNRILSDNSTYQMLSTDPSKVFRKELDLIIKHGVDSKFLNKQEAKYLIPTVSRTPVIYYLPKIHKDSSNPPGRPIVSGIESLTSRLGEYIDLHLQPLVKKTRAYLKDTKHTLQLIKELNMENDIIMATGDVSSLYTNIDHEGALEAVKWALDKEEGIDKGLCGFILKCLDFCLHHNFFWYNNKFFLQIKGVAMGAKFAPSVANLYMAKWEEESVMVEQYTDMVLYKRFIDDLIIMWKGSKESLMTLLETMNDNDRNISLTWDINKDRIHFLDLEILNTSEGMITRSFFKATDRNSYISTTSCQHKPWLDNIPRGQFMRMRRNCTLEDDFETQSDRLEGMFLDKGYRKEFLKRERNMVRNLSRDDLLRDKNAAVGNKEFDGTCIVLDYSLQSKDVERILKKYWSVLKQDTHLKDLLSDKPKIVYKKAPSLRDRLVHNIVEPPPPKPKMFWNLKGFFGCGRCYSCVRVPSNNKRVKEFSNPHRGKLHTIEDFISCDTIGVVYAIKCPCNLIYVGRTTRALKDRMEEHVRNIRKGHDKHHLSIHFKRVHNQSTQDMKFWGIEAPKRNWRGSNYTRDISKRESWWIYQLGSLSPGGLNKEFDLTCFLSNF